MRPRQVNRVVVLLVLLGGLVGAHGFQKPQQSPLPNLDQRQLQPARGSLDISAQSSAKAAALERLRNRLPKVQVEFDPLRGSPRNVHARDGFLSGPEARGRALSSDPSRTIRGGDRHRATRAFLQEHRDLFGYGPEALDRARIKREFVAPKSGLRTVVWEQEVDGIPVFEGWLIAHTTKQDELVALSSLFTPEPEQAANAGAGDRSRRHRPDVSARQAVSEAAGGLGEPVSAEEITVLAEDPASAEQQQQFTARPFNRAIKARLVWLPMSDSLLQLCWDVVLTSRVRGETFRVLVNAQTGGVLVRRCLTFYATNASYRVFTSDSPSPFSPGHLVSSTNQPPLVPRSLVTWSALNTNASPAGWISDGVMETWGNNVDAHLDRNGDDLPDLPRPQAASGRVFDFPLDLSRPPTESSEAAVVQLFYWCNWVHDRLYGLGFTEAAGNFQTTNFNRGGHGNDAVLADAQDGSGYNNANFTSTGDGFAPRIQMYLFDRPAPDRDGDLDAEIILHEYTHGLTDRLVGGGMGISEAQTAALAEGWSDFYALSLLSEPADDPNVPYPFGGYTGYLFRDVSDNYYYGIRRYPYCTDLSKNPLTFKDIDPAQATSHLEALLNPAYRPWNRNDASEVHNQGEVWCAMLWEARANLIARHGPSVGNELALQLVIDGLKLSPPNPNFIQARDAILLADQVNTDGANQLDLWRAFAKRGLGASSAVTGVIEAFDLPDDLLVTPRTGCTFRGPVGGPFGAATATFTLTNTGTNTLSWTLVNTSLWLSVLPTEGLLTPNSGGSVVQVDLNATAAGLLPGIYADSIVLSNLASGVEHVRTIRLRVGQPDYLTEQFTEGENDLAFHSVTFKPDGSASFYSVCRETTTNFPANPIGGTLLSLSDDTYAQVTLTGGVQVALFGQTINSFYVSDNGYITLNQGDTTYTESIETHFLLPRAAALFDDLDPTLGGSISWKQWSDRVAITYLDVPEYNRPLNRDSFQIELYFDGRIRFTWLDLNSRDGLVGLSRGTGVPEGFDESDFSAYGPCSPPLTLSVPAQVTELEGGLAVQCRVSLNPPPLTNVTITLSSSDPTEVEVTPTAVIFAGQADAPFDAIIVDDFLLDGTQTAWITASAPDYASGTAMISVADRQTASLAVVLPANAAEGSGIRQGSVQVSTAPDDSVTVSLDSSDTSEVQVPASVMIPAGQTSAGFNILVMDDTEIDGTRPATVTARVENWSPGSATMNVRDNESLSLTVTLPAYATENDGVLTDIGIVRLSGTLPTNLVVTLNSSDETELMVVPSLIIQAGQLSNLFTVTVVDDPTLDGHQSVTVTASAPGFTNGSATLTILDDESPPMPSEPRPAHQASNVWANAVLAWSNQRQDPVINGGFENGDFSGWISTNAGDGVFVINDGSVDPAGPDGPLPPVEGAFSSMTDQIGPAHRVLMQEVTVPKRGNPVLQWQQRLRNYAPVYGSNQYFRVELRDPAGALLSRVFTTQAGDLGLGRWTAQEYDLTPWRGQKVRIVFELQEGFPFFNAHVDGVQITGGISGGALTNDVYFGTNPMPGPAEFLGSTTNTVWTLPLLAPATTYYWQVVSRRAIATPGPVWSFTTRGVHHFGWNPLPQAVIAGIPVSVTLTAQDEFNSTVSNFTGTVRLTGLLSDGAPQVLFRDDFEDGDITDWKAGTGGYTRQTTTDTAANGLRSLMLEGGSYHHFDGLSRSLTNQTPGWIRFHVRTSSTNESGAYFVAGAGPSLQNSVVFFYMSKGGQMGLTDGPAFHSTSFVPYRWYKVVLALSWTQRTVDFYVDDVLVESGIPFRSDTVSRISVLYLHNFDNTLVWWDDIALGLGELERPIFVMPPFSTAFLDGRWRGNLVVPDAAARVTLEAVDDEQHRGASSSLASMGAPRILSISKTPENVTLRWESAPGLVYRVEYQTTLDSGNWTTLSGEMVAAGFTATKTDFPSASPRFYRVVLVR